MIETKPKRRWFRFSLRTLFVFVTIACIWLGSQASTVYHRRQLLSRLDSVVLRGFPTYKTIMFHGNPCRIEGEVMTAEEYQLPWIRRAFGDKLVPIIGLPERMSPEEVKEFKTAFPESLISQISNGNGLMGTIHTVAGKHFERLGDSITIK
jgi:hypothetical protein